MAPLAAAAPEPKALPRDLGGCTRSHAGLAWAPLADAQRGSVARVPDEAPKGCNPMPSGGRSAGGLITPITVVYSLGHRPC